VILRHRQVYFAFIHECIPGANQRMVELSLCSPHRHGAAPNSDPAPSAIPARTSATPALWLQVLERSRSSQDRRPWHASLGSRAPWRAAVPQGAGVPRGDRRRSHRQRHARPRPLLEQHNAARCGRRGRSGTANAEAVATPERLFSEETILALLNTIRWAMGHRVAWNVNQGVKGMMESVVRERPDW